MISGQQPGNYGMTSPGLGSCYWDDIPHSFSPAAAPNAYVRPCRSAGFSTDTALPDTAHQATFMRTMPRQLPLATGDQPRKPRPARSLSPMFEPSGRSTTTHCPRDRDITVIEKVVEQQGITAQEMQVMLQCERTRTSAALQEIIAEQSQSVTDLVREETQKIVQMVNAVSNSSSNWFMQLDADRSSKSGVIQGVARDLDIVQLQIAQLEQSHKKNSNMFEQSVREREEVRSLLERVTQDVRNQHGMVLTGIASQEEQQHMTEAALAGIHSDLEIVVAETATLKTNMSACLQKEKQILALQQEHQQGLQQKIDQANTELRRQLQQSMEMVRSEAANELQMVRQGTLMGLVERVCALETHHGDQDIKDLSRKLQAERTSRCELAQAFEAFRIDNLTRCGKLQDDVDALPDKMAGIARTFSEDQSVRERTVALELVVSELKSGAMRQGASTERQADVTRRLEPEVQELWHTIKAEHAMHSTLSQTFEIDRQAQIKANSELRAEIQNVTDTMVDLAAGQIEDRYARECCNRLEQGLVDLSTTVQQKTSQGIWGRVETVEVEVEEFRKSLQDESLARRDLSQALDAYRISHLQTSMDLRAEVDRTSEKLDRLQFVQSFQANADISGELRNSLDGASKVESFPNRLLSKESPKEKVASRSQESDWLPVGAGLEKLSASNVDLGLARQRTKTLVEKFSESNLDLGLGRQRTKTVG